MSTQSLIPQRVRHPLKFRLVQVRRTQQVTPRLIRVTFAGDDLADFASIGFDDHVKLVFPEPGAALPPMPDITAEGPRFPEGKRPLMRDYTPRRFDANARELDIEFVLHGHGPATEWAQQAQPGQYLGIGGPRGSFVIPPGYDWYLLIGDDTALPAISRRLEELSPGTLAIVLIEVTDSSARIAFDTRAKVELHWLYRYADEGGDDGQLAQVVSRLQLPDGEGYAWAAGESSSIRAVRQHLIEERGLDRSHIRAAGYWKRGSSGAHETIAD